MVYFLSGAPICHDAVGPRPSGQALAQRTSWPFTTLLEDKPVVDFVTKVRSGAPVMMGDPAFHYRGRMPVFPFLQDVELAAVYMFLSTTHRWREIPGVSEPRFRS